MYDIMVDKYHNIYNIIFTNITILLGKCLCLYCIHMYYINIIHTLRINLIFNNSRCNLPRPQTDIDSFFILISLLFWI